MNINANRSTLNQITRLIIPIVFAVVAYILLLSHADYLYALQEESLFVSGRTFMQETLLCRNGLWAWSGCFFTQFFYYPLLGSSIIIAMWLLSYYSLLWLTRWKDWRRIIAILPSCYLLWTLLCLGYWMYYVKSPGYAFIPTLVLLTVSLGSFLLDRLLLRLFKRVNWWQPYAVLIILFVACRPQLRIYSLTLPESRLYSELRMQRAIEDCRWQDVIDEHLKVKQPTNLMVLYKNIALMHSGRLQEIFKTNNCGVNPPSPISLIPCDTLHLHIAQLAATTAYYQYGQLNYAYRWAMENSVEYGPSVRNLKTMARCAILNQEFDLAEKYLLQLRNTMFHKRWADEQNRQLRSSTLVMQSADFQNIAPLLLDEGNVLDVDEGFPEQWILNHFSDLVQAANPKLEELIITTSLWTKDEYAFDIHFYNYVNNHPNDAIPLLYQEAAIMLCTKESSPIQLDNFPFDKFISDRYNNFVRDYNQLSTMLISSDEMAGRLHAVYGDTYWWYYYFYTDFNIY